MRVLLTGGGTAGHINPALAIAEIILRHSPDSEIAFVGVHGGKEEDLVPREGYPLYFVKSRGIERSKTPKAVLANVGAVWLAVASPYYRSTLTILETFKPDIVIGTGGYACWPIMSASARHGIPTALHESNAKPGLAVRRLQKKVDRIWINFERTADELEVRNTVHRVGNPLLHGFDAHEQIEKNSRLVLAFGGSLGAKYLNFAMLDLMHNLAKQMPDVRFLLSTGKNNYDECRTKFEELGLSELPNCVLTNYIYDMPARMAEADLIISRAGAMTLSEIAKLGKASVLVPSPYVADNHQFLNAKAFADANASVLVEEKTLADGCLTDTVRSLLADDAKLEKMRENVKEFVDIDAERLIWQDIVELVENNGRRDAK